MLGYRQSSRLVGIAIKGTVSSKGTVYACRISSDDALLPPSLYTTFEMASKKDQMNDFFREADKRFELQIPPGWKDKGKKTYDKYGDVILWFQLLSYAHANNKPIIFVTDDVKSDWFLSARESGGHPRPRPELVQEIFVEANVLFHAYPGNEFIDQATNFLKLIPEPSISADAKEVTEQNAKELNQVKHGVTVGAIWAHYAEVAVKQWLEAMYSQSEIIVNPFEAPDFVLVEPDGTKIGVEVKYKDRPFYVSSQ